MVPGGAYGIGFDGVAAAPAGLAPAPPGWPVVTFRVERGGDAPAAVGAEQALVPLASGGGVLVDRAAAAATVFAERAPEAEAIVHPLASVVASTYSRMLGREVLHGGAAVGPGGGAWAVLADRGGGKSTTLAALALAGWPVLADDLVVVDGGVAFRGPRCIDLRASAREALGVRESTVDVRGDRGRLALGDVDAEVTLTGLIFLEWGPELSVERLVPAERLQRLARHRAGGAAAGRPEAALALAALPAFELRRPREHGALAGALAAFQRIAGGSVRRQ